MKLNKLSISILFFVLLSSSVFGDCFSGNEEEGYTIDEDYCVFDCMTEGIDLSNGVGWGIFAIVSQSKNNIIIRNCDVRGWNAGIGIILNNGTTLSNNVVNSNNDVGISIWDSNHTTLIDNEANGNKIGIQLWTDNEHTILERIEAKHNLLRGIDLQSNVDLTVVDSIVTGNELDGIYLVGAATFNNNKVCNNGDKDFNCHYSWNGEVYQNSNASGTGNIFDEVHPCSDFYTDELLWPVEEVNYDECPALGDLNFDGGWNILDIVQLASCILANNCQDTWATESAGDLNGDGLYNILDVVTLANCILAENCG